MSPRPPTPPLHLRQEVPLALVAGALAAWASFAWLAPFHLGESLSAADFFDYCTAVVSLADEDPALWPLKRGRLPGLLAGALAPARGVIDALLLNAVAGTALTAAGIYLWGTALGGRVAGGVAVLFALTMSPLVLQARMLSFYPMVNAGLAWGAAGVAVAARTRSPLGLAVAGLGIAAALLVDVRGLVWALPALGTAAVLALAVPGSWKRRGLCVLALLLPLAASYPAGQRAFPSTAYSLEKQIDVRPLFHLHGARGADFKPPFSYDSAYVWGWSPLSEIPDTVQFLLKNRQVELPDGVVMEAPQGLVRRQVTPWIRAATWLAPCTLLLLFVARQPWRAWGLVGAAAPYLVALRSLEGMVEVYPRFLTQGLPAVAVLGGALVGLLFGFLPLRTHPRLRAGVGLGVVGIAAAVAFGALPSPLSPVAPWRISWAPVLTEIYAVGQDLRSPTGTRPGAPQEACVARLREDRRQSGRDWSSLVPFSDRVQRDYRKENSTVPPVRSSPEPSPGGPPQPPPGEPPAGPHRGP